ncbi:PhzF family phenazine biosynthesis protein [Rhizobium sp. SSA_523]|uniref:PhzF family phenazine biosynthesis protein n=1 Tax=Rhizobium sp. SSA_523 TaxID=2952477 RepID=UPI002091BA4C|nr:PhzF family phenazine biosynthesis protein [Rhizobium sp. SSA_523]MCO5730262.1 PhzF family phenazine biosynthesis protein [Rhizobium sp. SSA_523]WKC25317.1 PhzF family phenazine biosynthesis protein [Rhizobium sp. SSA_523]
MTSFAFRQVDVFCQERLAGNPLAVVHGADGLSDAEMAAFARWTNLSETTFLLSPTRTDADYRLRIFTPLEELPFAGHPTLGSCHAWLEAGGRAGGPLIRQECKAGLIQIRPAASGLAFQAPPLKRSGPVEEDLVDRVRLALDLTQEQVVAAHWVDNGPGWMALLLRSASEVLAVRPDFSKIKGIRVGLVGPHPQTSDPGRCDFEVRAFTAAGFEDPVTGSLNAGLASWLVAAGLAPDAYIAAQGTQVQRSGRVHVEREGDRLWIGGGVRTVIEGRLHLHEQ